MGNSIVLEDKFPNEDELEDQNWTPTKQVLISREITPTPGEEFLEILGTDEQKQTIKTKKRKREYDQHFEHQNKKRAKTESKNLFDTSFDTSFDNPFHDWRYTAQPFTDHETKIDYLIIPKGQLLYQGCPDSIKDDEKLTEPQWFGNLPVAANYGFAWKDQWDAQNGKVMTFITKAPLKILRITKNTGKYLIKLAEGDKKTIRDIYTMFGHFNEIDFGLSRSSYIAVDLRATQWMCKNGISGYAYRGMQNGGMNAKEGDQFHSEIALCSQALGLLERLPIEYRFDTKYPSCILKTINGKLAGTIPRTKLIKPRGYKWQNPKHGYKWETKPYERKGKNRSDIYQSELTSWENEDSVPLSLQSCQLDSDEDEYRVKYLVS